MSADLTDEDRAEIERIVILSKYHSTAMSVEAIYRAGLAAGNKERDYMLTVIEAAKAMRECNCLSCGRLPDGISSEAFDAARAKLEGTK